MNEDFGNKRSQNDFLLKYPLLGNHWTLPSQADNTGYNEQLSLLTSHLVSLADDGDEVKDDLLGQIVVKFSVCDLNSNLFSFV